MKFGYDLFLDEVELLTSLLGLPIMHCQQGKVV
jgi:hypothetical protein